MKNKLIFFSTLSVEDAGNSLPGFVHMGNESPVINPN